jgi:TetR/AcrR family transcriptional regulator, copper-responsive repressor
MARPRSFDRDAALEQAMLLFWQKGYEETSIGDLTRAMGIAAPSLYAAFGDKRALFDEAVERYESLPDAPIAAGSIERILMRAAEEYTKPEQPRGCFILSEPALQARRTASWEAIRERLGEDALASYVSAVLAGMSSRARDGASREELETIAALALRALSAPGP